MTQTDGRQVGTFIDPSWPTNLKIAINDLRDGYAHITNVTRKDKELQERWNSSFAQENRQMQMVLTKLQADVDKLSESQQREVLGPDDLQKLRASSYALKNEVQELRAEKKKLELLIADLMKTGEQYKEKLKRI